jgi:HSP20 family protein
VGDLRHGFGSLWDSVAEGWQRRRESATGAMTRFKPSEKSNLRARAVIDDES